MQSSYDGVVEFSRSGQGHIFVIRIINTLEVCNFRLRFVWHYAKYLVYVYYPTFKDCRIRKFKFYNLSQLNIVNARRVSYRQHLLISINRYFA